MRVRNSWALIPGNGTIFCCMWCNHDPRKLAWGESRSKNRLWRLDYGDCECEDQHVICVPCRLLWVHYFDGVCPAECDWRGAMALVELGRLADR